MRDLTGRPDHLQQACTLPLCCGVLNGKLTSFILVYRRHMHERVEEVAGDSQVENKVDVDEIGVDLNKQLFPNNSTDKSAH